MFLLGSHVNSCIGSVREVCSSARRLVVERVLGGVRCIWRVLEWASKGLDLVRSLLTACVLIILVEIIKL